MNRGHMGHKKLYTTEVTLHVPLYTYYYPKNGYY